MLDEVESLFDVVGTVFGFTVEAVEFVCDLCSGLSGGEGRRPEEEGTNLPSS